MRRLRTSLAKARTLRKAALIALALVACLALAVPVLAHVSAAYDLSWNVIAGGGGKMESTQHTLYGTVGQAATGHMSSSGHTLCSGFWCSGEVEYWVYLPLVLR
ncbi:MAG: hypothetical protein JW900_07080 [Anaerolineae bacterium]|nr:hypothetical protein [Anaerolineae bacterium]